MRFFDDDEKLVYWYHGIKVDGEHEHKLLTSEFGDDYDSIPMYEQIYALAGPTQTYRITGDPQILRDIEKTIDLFDQFYIDREKGGYFSHIDPLTLDPRAESLGNNRARKNWNSVGDHAPAYLINLYLATGEQKYADFLDYTFDTIAELLPRLREQPVRAGEVLEDWSHDQAWGWQQNRAVVGHNLKIAWNLMRMQSLRPKDEYVAWRARSPSSCPRRERPAARRLVRRGRARLKPDGEHHRFVWHDRKAWWQQEQAILAYLILNGVLRTTNTCGRRARRPPSTTPSSSTTTTAASTSTCSPTACPTCSATSGSRAATR